MVLKMFLGTVCDLIGLPAQPGEKRHRLGSFCQIACMFCQNSRWRRVASFWFCILYRRWSVVKWMLIAGRSVMGVGLYHSIMALERSLGVAGGIGSVMGE